MARFSLASLPLNTESSVPLPFFLATFRSPRSVWECGNVLNCLITLIETGSSVLTRGKIFLHVEMPSEICLQRPYLYKNRILMEPPEPNSCFLPCFHGVFSSCRNVFPITFLRVKTKKGAWNFYCGGRLPKKQGITSQASG